MRKFILLIFCAFPLVLHAQILYRVNIKCVSALNEQCLPYLTVLVDSAKNQTNTEGLVFLNLTSGIHQMIFSDGDNQLLDTVLRINSDTICIIKIKKLQELIGAKVLAARAVVNINQDRTTISQSTLKSISLPMSTNDPIHLLKLLPGISNSQEMNSSINVRGGDAYSTVFYLDNIPVPNLSHSFGLFSFFDLNTIRLVEVLNRHVSSEFGSRGSGFVKFYLMDPLVNKNTSEIQLNPFFVSSNLNVKLKKDRLGVFFNLRKSILNDSYNDLLPLFSNFHDILVKLKYNINSRSSFKLIFQDSKDRTSKNYGYGLELPDSSAWEFKVGSIEYSKISQKGIATELSGFFKSQKQVQKSYFEDLSINRFDEVNLKYIVRQKLLNKVNSIIGTEGQYHTNYNQFDSTNNTYSLGIISIFADHNMSFRKFKAFANFRASYFMQLQKYYLEKRIGIDYKLKSVNFLFELNDFVNNYHVISNNIFPVSSDYRFLPSTNFAPIRTIEKVVGCSHQNKRFIFQSNFYYRNYFNSLDYKLLSTMNQNSRSNIVKVDHKAYGIETAFNVNISKSYLLSLNYTYSKSILRSDSINNGKSYSSNYDRPHILNVINSYRHRRLVFTTTFTVQSGRPTSIPIYKAFGNRAVYSERNEFRLKLFHKLDLGLQYQFKNNKHIKQYLSVNIYNVYSRKNVYGIVVKKDNSNNSQYYYLTAFPILPSFSYSIRF